MTSVLPFNTLLIFNPTRITKNVYTLLKEAGINTSENTPYMFILSSIASPIAVEFAPDLKKRKITINSSYVKDRLSDVIEDEDLSRYIL